MAKSTAGAILQPTAVQITTREATAEMVQHQLITDIHTAVVEATAFDVHQQAIAKLQRLFLRQLIEASILPEAIK